MNEITQSLCLVYETMQEPKILTSLDALAAHDATTFYHSIHVAKRAALLSYQLQFNEPRRKELVRGSLLHDVGKLFVPTTILQKPGRLTDTEYEVIKQHPHFGVTYLKEQGGFSPEVLEMVQYHHENYDGTGYLNAKDGTQVSDMVRILRVVDSFDAMVSERPYHLAIPMKEACTLLQQEEGRFYDPTVVSCLSRLY